MTELACRKCGISKPRTTEFWETHLACKDGLRKTCRECMRPQRASVSRKQRANGVKKRQASRSPEKRAALWASWYARNKDNVLAARKRYRESGKGREKAREYELAYRERNREQRNLYAQGRRYGLTTAALRAMIKAQDGKCAICDRAAPLHVDHDHQTKQVRELLCAGCNMGLGGFRDQISILESAKRYLTLHTRKDQLCLAIAL